MTREDELNPTRQRGISTDVLAERISNLHEQNRSEFQALHHHLNAAETKVDGFIETFGKRVGNVEAALHDHTLQQHHPGTESKLLQLSSEHTNFERKFGEIDRTIAQMELDRVVEKAAVEARTKQRNTGFSAAEKTLILACVIIPVLFLIIDRLSA